MRLIDADELKKDICKWLRTSSPDENVMVDICDIAASVFMEVEEQPTVFDKEKVLEQLDDYLFEKYCIEGDENIKRIIDQGGEINDK